MTNGGATLEISVTVTNELLARLERIPGPEGTGQGCEACARPPTLRYRFRRELLERLADVVLDFPAPASRTSYRGIWR